MRNKPSLQNAYDLKSPDDNIKLYSVWAETYDISFIDDMQYELHFAVAEEFVLNGGKGLILDVGAGTGAVAEALLQKAKFCIEATDISEEMLNQKKKENNLIKTMEESLYEFKGKSVYFEKDSFFDKVNLKVEDHGDTLHVGEDLFPMRKAYTVKYKIPKGDSLTISQSFLSILSKKGKPIFFSSFKKDGYLQGKSKSLGRFLISRDSISPEIKAINFKEGQWLSNYDFMKLKISIYQSQQETKLLKLLSLACIAVSA